MTTTTGELIRLVEDVRQPGPLRVNRTSGTVHDVKLLGWNSSNNRRYLPEGVEASMYNGKAVKLNHLAPGQKGRDVRDNFGWVQNCVKRADGIYGELHVLNPKSDFAESVFNAAERKPDLFGLSHESLGKEQRGSRGAVIESVQKVEALAIVDSPATTRSLFESKGNLTMKTFAELYALIPAARSRLLREAADMAGLPDTAPVEVPAGGTPEEALKAGFRAAMLAIIDDDKLTTAEKIAKVREFLKLQDKALGDSASAPKEFTPAADEAPMPESREARAAWLNAPETPQHAGTGLLLESRAAKLQRAHVQRELQERFAANDGTPPADPRERARWLRAG